LFKKKQIENKYKSVVLIYKGKNAETLAFNQSTHTAITPLSILYNITNKLNILN